MRPNDHTTPTQGRQVDRSDIVIVDDIIYLPEPVDLTTNVVPVRWAYPAPEDGRPHTGLEPQSDRMAATRFLRATPTSFAASVETDPVTLRKYRLPIASALIVVTGQITLGATVGVSAAHPVIGGLVMLGWLISGCLLVAAQCIQIAGSNR